jgi:hypothetical protein
MFEGCKFGRERLLSGGGFQAERDADGFFVFVFGIRAQEKWYDVATLIELAFFFGWKTARGTWCLRCN